MGRSTQRRRWALRLIASAIITAALLVALQRRYNAIPASLAVPWWVIPAYFGLLVAYFVTRVGRWLFLLRPLGDVPLRVGMATGLAGTMWIAWLPWRIGELARPLILAQNSTIRFSAALGSIALERVVDGLFVCGLFFGSFALVEVRPGLEALYSASVGVVAVFLCALLVLVAMARFPRAVGGLVERATSWIVPGFARKLADVAHGVSEGLAALPSPRPLAWFLLGTASYWAINILGMWVLARGCDLELGVAETAAVMAVINLALLIPGPPAQLGTFHLGVLTGLSLFVDDAVVREQGVVYAFYLYACQLTTITTLGLLSHLRLEIRWREVLRSLTAQAPPEETAPAAPTEAPQASP
ncbi:MAG: flippase-like domain-containing protein [Myxococcales bacterium]|nr:flippase-like domain-containing protein [Myxococcales bacterium]